MKMDGDHEVVEYHHPWLHWSNRPAKHQEIRMEVRIPIYDNEMTFVFPAFVGGGNQIVVEMFRSQVRPYMQPIGCTMLRAVEIRHRFSNRNGRDPDTVRAGMFRTRAGPGSACSGSSIPPASCARRRSR